ncbi:MAG: DEAD/DEAH box helicase [marine benthic group bacterium]|nr:DEAD/DEAH box helicase [Candidatus Carthagonibacter metallireducens]
MTGLPAESGFHGLGLTEPLLDAIADRGYTEPTTIQVDAIPLALGGGDVLGCAQTGTGKTAAFVLPMLQRLAELPEEHGTVRGLILTPTRELADQVEKAVAHYGARLSLEPLVVYGGVPIGAQIKDLKFGCDVLVATPGRLLDHLERGTVDLARVEVLVLDEADRMLDMGFIDDVRKIVRSTPADRQTLLFSATMPNAILGLAHEMMRDPVSVQVGFQTAASGITEVLHPVDYAAKQGLVHHLLDSWGTGPAIVFTRMKSTAAYLCEFLKKKGVSVDDLHGDKSQADRSRSLTSFREGKTRVLVATNVAARGLDIAGITHVVNFDVPDDPKDYVHRVGRTARGDQTGDAVTLMSPHEVMMVREIEKLTGAPIPREVVPGFEPTFSADLGRTEAVDEDAAPKSRLSRGRRRR